MTFILHPIVSFMAGASATRFFPKGQEVLTRALAKAKAEGLLERHKLTQICLMQFSPGREAMWT